MPPTRHASLIVLLHNQGVYQDVVSWTPFNIMDALISVTQTTIFVPRFVQRQPRLDGMDKLCSRVFYSVILSYKQNLMNLIHDSKYQTVYIFFVTMDKTIRMTCRIFGSNLRPNFLICLGIKAKNVCLFTYWSLLCFNYDDLPSGNVRGDTPRQSTTGKSAP